jgi:hypothetical protein
MRWRRSISVQRNVLGIIWRLACLGQSCMSDGIVDYVLLLYRIIATLYYSSVVVD